MAEILIYDDIGPEWLGMVSAKGIVDELGKIGDDKPLTVRINSPGGSVTEAQAIYNAIARRSGETTIKIDGLAASAASYIMLAGDRIEIAENAMVMIHKAWSYAIGNADEMRNSAAVLDKFDDILLSAYVARSGGKRSRDELSQAMADETWLNATEAKEWGLVDEIGQPLKVAACVSPGRFAKAPPELLNPEAASEARQRRQEALKNRLRLLKAKST